MILPPAFAFVVMFIKDTALASQIGVVELTFARQMLNNRGFSAVLVFGTILVLYFILSYPLSRLGAIWRTALPHLEVADLASAYGTLQVLHEHQPVGRPRARSSA